ncbi:trk system potassium uptake protein TrkA [Aequitasia blattaphilus]|uniref:Trk system potassium uptake protein TrkA n=1 Tax=Aequitasia blattaphilus TaxID=2949332 RepID=A0ABT1E784_9FIRM|nr:Trk system potassium transporter TrkA [Aequitasia blattaphilus]MCP1101469.1 Trk system potassium transporter TrkA [Aequitasia blattaphilus]MCR8614109.1 Trk system potassium transporter TrkA [Aequitasia blattaphilus]
MRIVIIGDGKVGHKLAVELSEEEYDVTLIDQNEGKLRNTIDKLDIFTITGNGADAEVQKDADVPEADLVIACASTDELNMLSCLLAKRLGAKNTIARVRSPIYYRQLDLLKEDLQLSMAVNPERAAADEIARVLIFPDASKVETFVKGRVELVEHAVKEGSKMIGLSLAELYKRYQIKVLVCAVKRKNKVYIPSGEFVIEMGDILHIASSHQGLEKLFSAIGRRARKIKNVLICGGSHVSYYLAKRLLEIGMRVKIIEKKRERAEELCCALHQATIINGDGANPELLQEEGIDDVDAIVCLTGMDEENIIMALYAQTVGVEKIIAKVNDDSRARMIEGHGILSTVSAKSVTANEIVSYVRAMKNSERSSNIETIYQLVNGQIEAMEFIIKKETSYTGIPLKDLSTTKNSLIACIVRRNNVIIPSGNDILKVGDSVVVITNETGMEDLSEILD